MRSQENNYAFIDGQNVYLGVKRQGWIIDWRRFRTYLREKYNVTQAFFFIGYMESNEPLYSMLKKSGYILIFKPTVEVWDGNRMVTKGNVDAELVLHTMIEYPHFDRAVLVSGDGDFACLVEYLRKKQKLEVLIVPHGQQYSGLLKGAAAKKIASLTELQMRLQYMKRTP